MTSQPQHRGFRIGAQILPLAVVAMFSLLLLSTKTHRIAATLIQENHAVETATFAFALIASVLGFWLVGRLFKRGGTRLTIVFYTLFALGMFFIAGEEIAWGQNWLHFTTPDAWKRVNYQQETTLHNLNALQSMLELFALTYGVSGIIGVALGRVRLFSELAPPSLLLGCFIVIAVFAGIDFMHDYWIPNRRFDNLVNDLDEVIELLVAASGAAYMGWRLCWAKTVTPPTKV